MLSEQGEIVEKIQALFVQAREKGGRSQANSFGLHVQIVTF